MAFYGSYNLNLLRFRMDRKKGSVREERCPFFVPLSVIRFGRMFLVALESRERKRGRLLPLPRLPRGLEWRFGQQKIIHQQRIDARAKRSSESHREG